MSHDGEAPQAEEVGASVGVRIEAVAQSPRRRADQQAAEFSPGRRADFAAQLVEQLADRPLEELERDVAGEAVRDDDVRGSAQEVARLGVAREVERRSQRGARVPRA